MMPVWIGCMRNNKLLGDGMNKGYIKDFVAPKQRINNEYKSQFKWGELLLIIILIIIIGCV